YKYPPETILSHEFFYSETEEFYRFYKNKMFYPDAAPNGAHVSLSELERRAKVIGVVTQNIDGLHQQAGSKTVYELHGSIKRNYCTRCGKFFDGDFVFNSVGIPRCDCGGLIKPDVVLYGEGLDGAVVEGAVDAISSADMLLVAGTSLTVYPAAGFLSYFRGDSIVLINRDPTPFDSRAGLVIRDPVGKIMSEAMEMIK
ncbi:MAG: NAD-dependent protein deacylase, partial [Clostridia bacterium]|nr:NAD-dependent protein deacylase [Clostridia bacterium]